MTLKKVFTAVIFAMSMALLSAHAEAPKVGAVSLEVVMKESKFAQHASKVLSDEFAPRKAEIEQQIATINTKASTLDRDKPILTEQQISLRQQEISTLDHDIRKLQRDFQSDLEAKRRDSIQRVLALINKVVLRIAKEENYDAILQNAVYASQNVNLTQRVIAEMDKEAVQ